MPKYVYDFREGRKEMAELLGGKGANLAEMTRLGLPVPMGFTVSTEACRIFLATGREPAGLAEEVAEHLAALESAVGRSLGDSRLPLLLSVRSGGRFSMPGMMDTVLNIGLNDSTVDGLARWSGDERFAWDAYRRLIQMYGKTVLGLDGTQFEKALSAAKRVAGTANDLGLDADALRTLVKEFADIVTASAGRFPQDPHEQLRSAIRAVFESWSSERATIYRRQEHIPDDLGTAVNVQMMVFGNIGAGSGTGVAFTRDPATGAPGPYGDYLADAQGEDVVAGIRNTVSLAELENLDKTSYDELISIMARLEEHYRDLCDIEFTVERGKLWMLQTRVGKRTAEAAFRIAAQLVDEGVIDLDEAVRRVTGEQLARLMFPRFDERAVPEPVARGVAASPGAAVGQAVFDSATAVRRAAAGDDVILVRRETNPDDLAGMIAARGVLTSRGGKTSHAAVVARGMGRTCVSGADDLDVDVEARRFTTAAGVVVDEGDTIAIDGTSGAVYVGQVPVVASDIVAYLDGEPRRNDLIDAVERILAHADRIRRLGVRANADTGPDAVRARRFGADGIGLARTEHMFLGDRRVCIERLVLAETDAERRDALAALLPLQRSDFVELLEAMDGRTVIIRLLDPPLHEFLPDLTELSVRVALAEAAGQVRDDDVRLLHAVRRLHEQNPMLGLRGVRLSLVIPDLCLVQVRALGEAIAERKLAGGDPRAEIMVPLIDTVEELRIIRPRAEQILAEIAADTGVEVRAPIGTMIELPRAALTAGEIATAADFFSFGTNDLTQTTWGMSRDDVESEFFPGYLAMGIFTTSPFETIDRAGVGRLVEIGVAEGRAAHPGLQIGVCGEHGGDPASIHFFDSVGLDYVSCSPFRVPIARLEAGRAVALVGSGPASDTR